MSANRRHAVSTPATMYLKWVVMTLLLVGAFLLSGCVTSTKYRLSPADTPPAPLLNITTGHPALKFNIASVIIYQGPGSWKQQARWDEYVVDVTNLADRPIVIETVSLVDPLGYRQHPGVDPWELEGQTESNWERYSRYALYSMGAGAITGASFGLSYGAAMSGSAAAAWYAAVPFVLLGNAAVVGVMNVQNKRGVEAEFMRRRLWLPLSLNPGSAVQGSFFFPVVPTPQRVELRGRAGVAPLELVLELKPLAGLHVKTTVE